MPVKETKPCVPAQVRLDCQAVLDTFYQNALKALPQNLRTARGEIIKAKTEADDAMRYVEVGQDFSVERGRAETHGVACPDEILPAVLAFCMQNWGSITVMPYQSAFSHYHIVHGEGERDALIKIIDALEAARD